MSLQFKDYSESIKRKMEAAQLQALKNYGENWKKIVRRIIKEKGIYDTGRLHDSMDYKINQQKKEITTGTDVPYAIFNELGTYRMKARPFLQPSVEEANGGFAEIIRQEVDREMSSTQGLTAEVRNL